MSGDGTCQKDVLVPLVQDGVHAWPFTYIDLPEPQSFRENRKVIHQCELPRVAPQKMQKGLHAKELWAAVRDPAYAPL